MRRTAATGRASDGADPLARKDGTETCDKPARGTSLSFCAKRRFSLIAIPRHAGVAAWFTCPSVPLTTSRRGGSASASEAPSSSCKRRHQRRKTFNRDPCTAVRQCTHLTAAQTQRGARTSLPCRSCPGRRSPLAIQLLNSQSGPWPQTRPPRRRSCWARAPEGPDPQCRPCILSCSHLSAVGTREDTCTRAGHVHSLVLKEQGLSLLAKGRVKTIQRCINKRCVCVKHRRYGA